jgi:hypothetical protein
MLPLVSLADDPIKRTIGVLRRTEVTQACVRLAGETFKQSRRESRLADACLVADEE